LDLRIGAILDRLFLHFLNVRATTGDADAESDHFCACARRAGGCQCSETEIPA
jgi:hypothetical protein